MSQITSIVVSGTKSLITLILDNKHSLRIDPKIYSKWKFKKGMYLSNKELDKIKKDIQLERVINGVVNYLSFRPRSEYELRTYINEKLKKMNPGLDNKEIIETVIDKLKKRKMINDESFVEWWIDQRTKNKPLGNNAIRYELRLKRINERIIQDKLSSRDEKNSANNIILKKFSSIKQSDFCTKQKIFTLLKRKGYSWDTIRKVVDELLIKK
jgi:regulatory protein